MFRPVLDSARIAVTISIIALGLPSLVAFAAAPTGQALDPEGIAELVAASKGSAEVSISRATGAARFVRLAPGVLRLDGANKSARATSFLARHGSIFGISDPASELTTPTVLTDTLGATHHSYRQVYQGVPVFAAILRVHFDAEEALSVVNGTFIPGIAGLDAEPSLSAVQARGKAVTFLRTSHPEAAAVSASAPTLYVFRTNLARGTEGTIHLVWEVEVEPGQGRRDQVYVDAHSGKVVDHIRGIHEVMHRRIYDSESNYPNTPFWVEGDPFPTNVDEADDVIEATADSYNFFQNAFGFDSYDGQGATMHAIFNRTDDCPNASWNGEFTSYCPGITADDTVAHEWTHAYTGGTHGLIYEWQPGALNEAYSDIFGETVDLINGLGTDTPDALRTGGCSLHGGNPTPQMTIDSPAELAGPIAVSGAAFNPQPPITVTATIELVNDGNDGGGTESVSDGCQAFQNFTPGAIALLDRGNCVFVLKMVFAEAAGASAVIVANYDDELLDMGGSGTPTIPAVLVASSDGDAIKEQLDEGVTATLDFDASTDDSVRWLAAEDSSGFGGAIRDMSNPTCFGDPGKVSDVAQYRCGPVEEDGGGVHTNSGVPNHAYVLLVDGGTYNGHTVAGIGLTRAAHIYWRAMSVYQVPVTDFADHADSLETSCSDLIGVNLADLSSGQPSGDTISTADCQQVTAAIQAVEMRTPPTACNFMPLLAPDAPEPDPALVEIFSQDFASDPAGSWTMSNQGVFPEWVSRNWVWTADVPPGGDGAAIFADNDSLIGDCIPGSDDQSGTMYLESPEIAFDRGGRELLLVFDHWVATETGYDGGNLKISVDGGGYQLIRRPLFQFNPYNAVLIPADNSNPMAGQIAFTGSDEGSLGGSWGQSQVDLRSLVSPGQTFRLRFDFGLDGCNGMVGWYVDNVRVLIGGYTPRQLTGRH